MVFNKFKHIDDTTVTGYEWKLRMDLSWLFEPAQIQFCEATLPGLIKHPADTWTNIGYFVAGITILCAARRPLERLLAASALWTGVGSTLFHASNTVIGETLDLSGMFMFILTFAAFQQHRARPDQRVSRYVAGVLLLTLLLTVLSTLSEWLKSPLFGLLVALVICRALLQEIGFWSWSILGCFAVAWTFWWLDYLHLLCIPGNHILTGHGVWHLLNGLVFWLAFQHFRDPDKPAASNSAV